MELPQIGRNCDICNRNDYLPFKCAYCDKIVCIDHKANHGKECPMNDTKFEAQKSGNFESLRDKCDFCKRITLRLELSECQHCQSRYCLYHRHQAQHDCPKLDADREAHRIKTERKEERKKEALDKLKVFTARSFTPAAPPKKPTDPKKQALARKIRIIKIKQSARGPPNVRTEEKLHFEVKFVHQPEVTFSSALKHGYILRIFTTARHTVGRMIDWVATELDLSNKNQIAAASQLVFQKVTDAGTMITLDSQRSFGDLLGNRIEDGDELIITYTRGISEGPEH